MPLRPLTLLAALAACNTPTLGYFGIAPVTVTFDGSTFDIRRRGDTVQGIRTSPEAFPDRGDIAVRFGRAVQQATGCDPIPQTLAGDTALLTIRVDCAYRRAARNPLSRDSPSVIADRALPKPIRTCPSIPNADPGVSSTPVSASRSRQKRSDPMSSP